MLKLSRIISTAMIVLLLTAGSAQGREEAQIRVLLASGLNTVTIQVSEGSYQILDGITSLPIAELNEGDDLIVNQAGTSLQLLVDGESNDLALNGSVQLIPLEEDDLHVIGIRGTKYRGSISVGLDKGSLQVINKLGIESYLYGVVGPEMGGSAPEEALQAQAIVSRSYALSFSSSNLKYDVNATTVSQVYGGYSAEKAFAGDRVVAAIDATRNKVIYYWEDGKKNLVQAYFHSNAGGYTEDSENVWKDAIPYLRGVASPEDAYAVECANKTGRAGAAESYQWTKSLDKAGVAKAIADYNKKKKSPIVIGDFQEMILYPVAIDGKSPTVSGRITKIELIGDQGKALVYKDDIRSLFGLKSTLFSVSASGDDNLFIMDSGGNVQSFQPGSGTRILGAAEFLVDLVRDAARIVGRNGTQKLSGEIQTLTFHGFGYGHGVGMSQWGAMGMAAKGADYQEIINRYYNQGKENDDLTIENYN